MNNTIPLEIKKWIEDEAQRHVMNTAGDNTARIDFIRGATSLYQHLSGRVAELEKEVERLKGLVDQAFYAGRTGEKWTDFIETNNL